MNEQQSTETELEPIAIVGMACRFPKASTLEEFWNILCQGDEAISFFTDDELLASGVDPVELQQANYIKAKGMVEGIEDFDPHLFGYTPREAELMDPQQRILLECAWQLLEQAALNPDRYSGDIASYVGVGMNIYLLQNLLPHFNAKNSDDSYQMLIGSDKDFAATRLAYKLNLTGAAVAVNTACSTSLVAVHQACQSLWDYQSDAALAGGATFLVPQKTGYLYQQGGIPSSDGHCRPFDRQAGGTVPSSGAGLVLLKRLEDAIADNDTIYALIKGTAVNNDGADKIGFTAPSVNGQAAVIAEAMAAANVSPESISYIEAHGTATALGDPIEVAALKLAFADADADEKQFCALASLKSNFGHMDTAAGIAGLMKAALALHHKKIPASLHFNQANPEIDFDDSPFYVNRTLQAWEQKNYPRRAGVSSFGIGGTNAHVVLEQAPDRNVDAIENRQPVLLPLSAKTPKALHQLADQLAQYLKANPDLKLNDVAYSLALGRRELECRTAILAGNTAQAIERLAAIENTDATVIKQPPAVVFMFPGQGSQKIRMGQALYSSEPVFKNTMGQCFDILLTQSNIDLKNILFPETGHEQTAEQQLNNTEITQPALFAVEYSLAQLLMSWGIKPAAMIGHSLGEYVAACVAGVFDLPQALKLVAQRAALMQAAPEGAMLAVMSSESECQQWLSNDLSLAAVNGEQQCVISGSQQAMDELQTQLNNQQILCQPLTVSHAFHTPLMQSAADGLGQNMGQVDFKINRIPYISNLTGRWIEPSDLNADYWKQHMLQPVKFAQGLQAICTEFKQLIVLEVGFGKTLQGLLKQVLQPDQQGLATLLTTDAQGQDSTYQALSQLWQAGIKVDWPEVFQTQHQRIPLPTYPFQRQRCWVDATVPESCATACSEKGKDLSQWFSTVNWQRSLQMPDAVMAKADCCLFFTEANCIFQPDNNEAIQINRAEHFLSRTEKSFFVNPEQEQDFQQLLTDLSLADKQILDVIYCWNLTGRTDSENFAVPYLGLMNFCKVLHQLLPELQCRITVITQGLFSVTGAETELQPMQALMLGPVKVIPQEYPQIQCRLIDLEPGQDNLPVICNLGFEQNVLAWRNGYFWLPELRPVTLTETNNRLKSKGLYLITGGLGGIGLSLAAFLARKYQANLLLTTRQTLPERSQWQHYLNQGDQGSFAQLVASLQQKEQALTTELAITVLADKPELKTLLEQLCALHLLRFFDHSGIAPYKGKQWTLEALKEKLSLLPKFDKFLLLLLEILQRDELIEWQDNQFGFTLPDRRNWEKEIAQLEQQISQDYAGFKPLHEMVRHCVDHYAQALSGNIEAISVLYPDGDRSLISETGENTVEHSNHRVYYQLLNHLVHQTIDNSNDVVRILEVGGGSGVLTGTIVPGLKGKNVEYYFTDIGKSFVMKVEQLAQQQGFDFMRFAVFDIFQDPVEQGFELQSFDLIYGLDVVHATPDIKFAVSQLSRLLKPGGDLCLVETPPIPRWYEMVWGLAEGWWYFEDSDLRSGTTPLLSPDKWQQVMQDSGLFAQVEVFPKSPEQRQTTDCCLVMGRVAGVRQQAGQSRQLADVLQSIMDMERAGASVKVCQADVTDAGAMQRSIAEAQAEFGPIDGIFHTAASDSRGYIDIQNKQRSLAELNPKVMGTQVLQQCIDFSALDFVFLFSSLNAVTGGQGNIAYTAANSYLDAVAHYYQHHHSARVYTVDWDRWQSLGQAVDFEQRVKNNTGVQLKGGITEAEGFDLIQRVLASGYPQLLVNTGRTTDQQQTAGDGELNTGQKEQTSHQRPQLAQKYIAPHTEMQRLIEKIWSEVLGIEQLGIDDDFYALGGDSLIAIRVMSRLKESLNLNLEVKLLFENTSIAKLAGTIESMQAVLQVSAVSDVDEAEYEGGVI